MRTLIATSLILATIAGGADRDLSARIEPLQLKRYLNILHERLRLPDVRTWVGTWNGVRLVCLNDRFASFSFTFTRKNGERYDFEWKKIESGEGGQTASSGDGVTTADVARALDDLLASKGFRNNPTATLPVAVGHPYVYIVEAVHDGEYQAIYRDMPRASWRERKLVEFNRVARIIVNTAGVAGEEVTLPSEPVALPPHETQDQE